MKQRDYKDATDLVVTGGFFDEPTHSLRADGFDASEDGTGRGTPLVPIAIGLDEEQNAHVEQMRCLKAREKGGGTSSKSHAMVGMAVRRLTPTECARLQAFPDDWLDIEFKVKPASDGAKYKALGNAVTVSVIRWIAERIKTVSGAQPIVKVLDVVDPEEPVL